MRYSLASALLTAAILQACGGTAAEEPVPVVSEYERLREEAAAKSLQVQALIDPAPCTQSSQCSSLIPVRVQTERYFEGIMRVRHH